MQAADSILIVLLLTNFFILGTANLRASIRVVAVQGILLSLLPIFVESEATVRLIVLVIATAAIKGALIPALLLKAIREVHIRHEVEPYLGFIPSLFLCTIGTGLALLFGDQLPLAPQHRDALFVPAALATLLAGFLVLTTRRKAISQVTGYLMLENGIFLFGLTQSPRVPFLVEIGVLLDVFVGVFIMGIVVFHINREFDSISASRLSELRD